MPEYHRESDSFMENKVKLAMKVISTIGFPIVVCGWLMYKDSTQGKEELRQREEMTTAINALKENISILNLNIQQQTRALKHKRDE